MRDHEIREFVRAAVEEAIRKERARIVAVLKNAEAEFYLTDENCYPPPTPTFDFEGSMRAIAAALEDGE